MNAVKLAILLGALTRTHGSVKHLERHMKNQIMQVFKPEKT